MRVLGIALMLAMIFASGEAFGLRLEPNPLAFGGRAAGEIELDLADSTLTMTVEITRGKLNRLRVAVRDVSDAIRYPVNAGTLTGDDVSIRRIRILDDGAVEFYFRKSYFHPRITAGETSNPFWIEYEVLAAGDSLEFMNMRHSIFGTFAPIHTFIVPEPDAWVLLAIAGAMASLRRRLLG